MPTITGNVYLADLCRLCPLPPLLCANYLAALTGSTTVVVVSVVVPTVVAQVSTLQVSTFVESVVAGASVFAPELHAAIENATAAIKMNFFMLVLFWFLVKKNVYITILWR